MSVVTRFAPSPTGFLHIGGARTALFNRLLAHHHGGRFLLRIEDTDRKRSTQAAIDAILDGMNWLGLAPDTEPVFQSRQAARHVEVAEALVASGHAYYCYCSPEELEVMRAEAKASGAPMRYNGLWRDRDPGDAPAGIKPVVRFKAPKEGATTIRDMVQGDVTVGNDQLDDLILLRADKSPTYMLSVVVDDHDMGVTHVIRGDDHLTNAFRQLQIFRAMGWPDPIFGHVPLIHGADGGKLSKRHGALGVDSYRDMGLLPEAVRNYLLRLGWGHGDDEIISDAQAIEWFDGTGIGRSPARFDVQKLLNLNAHYLREATPDRVVDLLAPNLLAREDVSWDDAGRDRLIRGMSGLTLRAKDLNELADNAAFYVRKRPLPMEPKAAKLLDETGRARLSQACTRFEELETWSEAALEQACRDLSEDMGLGLGKIAQPLRSAVTGSSMSPGLFEVLAILGREESLGRLHDAMNTR